MASVGGVLASLVALTCSGFNFATLYFGLSRVACLLCAKGGGISFGDEAPSSYFGDNNSCDGNE